MADAQYFELCSLVIVRLVFALHGSVMNTMLPSCITEVRTEVLIDMMADLNLSCPRKNPGIITSTLAWSGSVPQYVTMISAERSARGLDWQWSHFSRSLLCLYCMVSWWTRYHNDHWWLRSRSRCSRDGAFSFFFFFFARFDCVQLPDMHCLVRWWPPRNHDLFELQIWRTWWLISWGFLCEETNTIPMVIDMMGAIRVSCL